MDVKPLSTGSEWKTGIFGCAQDPQSCWDVFFCPACNIARQWAAADGRHNTVEIPVCVATLLGCLHFTTCMLRWNVINRFNVDEAPVVTVLATCVMPLCSACQTYRELARRGAWSGGTCCIGAPHQPLVMKGDEPPVVYSSA